MFKIFTYDREFVYYLPGPGKGTLSNRLDDIKDYEIYAKTGTIRYISSLTGVSLSRELAFSFIAYGKEPTEKREEAIDKLLSKILSKI
jgi:D-alanyl-D-alanine carboxypeptidase (penicillin-binding protein 4)